MTAQEMFASISEVLVEDEEILSARERELLASILQRAKAVEPDQDAEILAVIAHAVGDTIAQRASVRLGSSIAERILRSPLLDMRPEASCLPGYSEAHKPARNAARNTFSTADTQINVRPRMGTPSVPPPSPQPAGPRPPSPGPPSPGISTLPGPRPPSPGPPSPATPTPSGPLPPSTGPRSSWVHNQSEQIAVSSMPSELAATCIVLDEFLMPGELDSLLEYTLGRESDFMVSEVISPGVTAGMVDHEHRRSRVLYDLGEPGSIVAGKVQECLPRILGRLGREMFPISRVEAQITASNHGDFFRWHCDDGQFEVAKREITFVYFFHREPKRFGGGELRLHRSLRTSTGYVPGGEYRAIVPEQNQLVVFPSSLAHEITLVECPSRAFASSRLTVNGWFHR